MIKSVFLAPRISSRLLTSLTAGLRYRGRGPMRCSQGTLSMATLCRWCCSSSQCSSRTWCVFAIFSGLLCRRIFAMPWMCLFTCTLGSAIGKLWSMCMCSEMRSFTTTFGKSNTPGVTHHPVLHDAVKHPAFGDKKYSARVNPNTRRTKALGLSVVPTRVDRRDTKRVFGTVWKTLLFLESKNRNQCYVSHVHIRFRGKTVLFGDLIGHL